MVFWILICSKFIIGGGDSTYQRQRDGLLVNLEGDQIVVKNAPSLTVLRDASLFWIFKILGPVVFGICFAHHIVSTSKSRLLSTPIVVQILSKNRYPWPLSRYFNFVYFIRHPSSGWYRENNRMGKNIKKLRGLKCWKKGKSRWWQILVS